MSSRLMPEHEAAAALLAELLAAEVKRVSDVLGTFEVEVSRLVVDVFNARISGADMARRMRTFITVYGRQAYTEGMREGGIEEPEAEISDDDERVLAAWVESQRSFAVQFAADAQATRTAEDRRAAQTAILERLQLWIQSLRDIGSQGRASAQRNMMVTWRLGDTEEHCRTCQRLDGQRHRLSWFMDRGYRPQENGSDTLECGGWRCDCGLFDATGNRVYPV